MAKATEKVDSRKEGVLMIITVYGVIVFHLITWIAFDITKPIAAARVNYGENMLGFAYPAIPSRHEVPG